MDLVFCLGWFSGNLWLLVSGYGWSLWFWCCGLVVCLTLFSVGRFAGFGFLSSGLSVAGWLVCVWRVFLRLSLMRVVFGLLV